GTPSCEPASRRLRVWQLLQLAVAALLNPYHTVMSLAVFAASLARARTWRVILVWLPAGCAVVVMALAIAGYFSREAGRAMWGFDAAGSNLLGALVPRSSGWLGE